MKTKKQKEFDKLSKQLYKNHGKLKNLLNDKEIPVLNLDEDNNDQETKISKNNPFK